MLISDSLADEGLAVLEASSGLEFDYRPKLDPSELLRIIPGYDGLIIRSGTKVTADVIGAGEQLRVVGRAGIGVDNVDLTAASARGVIVMNTPEGNAITTAEHAIALLASLARQIPQATASIKGGRWEKTKFSGVELYGKVLGVVGLGNIGSIVADRALGLRMRVIAFDPLVTQERAQQLGVELVGFDELLQRADAITLHVPKTKETEGLIGDAQFARMKDGVLLVNAARGGIVDEAALLRALESGKVWGAALDVFATEPVPTDNPLLRHEQVIVTPHIGAATEQAQLNVAIAVAVQVRDFLLDGVVRNAVNLPSVSAQELAELGPFLGLGEKLGLLAGQLCRSVRQVDVEYAGRVADLNVKSITRSVLKGLLAPWVGSRLNLVNAPHLAAERGIRVVESKAAEARDFVNRVRVRVQTPEGERSVAGTIFGRTQPRIVAIDDFPMEALPEGPSLLIHNRDEPGVVGHVGTTLGRAGINISRMQLALRAERGDALQLLNLGSAPSAATLEALRSLPAVLRADVLDLGPGVG